MRITFFLTVAFMLVSIVVLPCSADAAQSYYFWFASQCEPTPAYGYSQQYQQMDSDKSTVQIRHSVVGEDANVGFTNLLGIHEYGSVSRPPMGAKWSVPNGIYYSVLVSLRKDHSYAPCGRANTKYYDMYGLTMVRIEGHWKAN